MPRPTRSTLWAAAGSRATTVLTCERPGGRPVFQNIGAVSAEHISLRCSLPGRWTDPKPAGRVSARWWWVNVIASAPVAGVGDGPQPHTHTMSRAAIAAVLALEDASVGERLAAFSLASFANSEQRAWPGTRLAAARAGLSKSQYLAARDGLLARGLIEPELEGGGRGRSPVLALRFALAGPWFDEQVNAPLVEAVLSHSRARGSARLLLTTLAAIAGEHRAISGLSGELIRAAAGLAETTYRRAREQLLAAGELALDGAGGGRGRTNGWRLADPRALNPDPIVATRRRVGPPGDARPLVAAAKPVTASRARLMERAGVAGATRGASEKGPRLSGVSGQYAAQNGTLSLANGPELTGVSAPNPAENRTVSAQTPPETPPQTPPETPPPNARARREPWNRGTPEDPPDPPDKGDGQDTILVEQTFLSERGRRRRRSVPVDLADVRRRLRPPGADDRSDWDAIRASLVRVAGESRFEIWLAPVELIAVDPGGALVLAAPLATSGWVSGRFGAQVDKAADAAGRRVRFADEAERAALHHLERPGVAGRGLEINHKEAS